MTSCANQKKKHWQRQVMFIRRRYHLKANDKPFLLIPTCELETEAGPGPEWSPCSADTERTAGGRCWKSQAARALPSVGWAACQLSQCCSFGPALTLWSRWSDAVSGAHRASFQTFAEQCASHTRPMEASPVCRPDFVSFCVYGANRIYLKLWLKASRLNLGALLWESSLSKLATDEQNNPRTQQLADRQQW